MMSIDMCHILLDKLWKYDKGVVHDRLYNMYTLNIKRKCVVLAPMRKGVIIEIDS